MLLFSPSVLICTKKRIALHQFHGDTLKLPKRTYFHTPQKYFYIEVIFDFNCTTLGMKWSLGLLDIKSIDVSMRLIWTFIIFCVYGFWRFRLKFSFYMKASRIETIFHLIWSLLRKCQIIWKIVSTFCGLFRMSDLYK